MKELSIEEKARRYDEAIERAKEINREHSKRGFKPSDDALYIFPELKESDGEKIRQFLIHEIEETSNEIMSYRNMNKKDVIAWLEKQSIPQVRTGLEWVNTIDDACDKRYSEEYAHGEYCHEQSFKWGFQEGVDWLEKQGEQKSIIEMKTPEESLGIDSDTYNKIVDECIYGEQKPADKSEPTDYNSIDPYFGKPIDKVEPKFKVGDKVIGIISGIQYYITKVCDNHYCTESGCIIMFDAQDNFELVEQQLKKIEQKPTDKIEPKFKVGQTIKKEGFNSGFPIVKIEDGFYYNDMGDNFPFTDQDNWELVEQKPADWSEDDEEQLDRAIYMMEQLDMTKSWDDVYNWLKSLKDRIQSQNTITDKELAQAKKDAYNEALDKIEYHSGEPTFDDGWSAAIWYLKKRNTMPQNTWRPSDEQMKALDDVISSKDIKYDVLSELYKDLKKLREE